MKPNNSVTSARSSDLNASISNPSSSLGYLFSSAASNRFKEFREAASVRGHFCEMRRQSSTNDMNLERTVLILAMRTASDLIFHGSVSSLSGRYSLPRNDTRALRFSSSDSLSAWRN